jgi:hypothetical protein
VKGVGLGEREEEEGGKEGVVIGEKEFKEL